MTKLIDHTELKTGRFANLPTKRACIDCPLRRISTPGHLGGYTVAQYLEILHGIADIACHLSPGFPHNAAEQRSCTGVAMYRANNGLRPWGHAMEAVEHVGPDPVTAFDSPASFAAHHSKPKS